MMEFPGLARQEIEKVMNPHGAGAAVVISGGGYFFCGKERVVQQNKTT